MQPGLERFNFPVHPALAPFVHAVALEEVRVSGQEEQPPCFFPPTPLQCLLFYLGDPIRARTGGSADRFEDRGRCIVVGPQVSRVDLQLPAWHRVLIVTFYPGGLYRLLGIPLQELFDDGFDAGLLLGPAVRQLTERLLQMPDNRVACAEVERFLLESLGRLQQELPVDRGLHKLLQSQGLLSMDRLASLSCLSIRQLERTCRQRIGMSPKLFARITRFSHAYRLHETCPHFTWTHVAHAAGYYDQMHLIKDFKVFAGATPSMLSRMLQESPVKLQSLITV
ncbi:MAG TPA: helix-turn-helix domain-containing protein [Lacibacter sp.]|nr:helix-turn-helix domain-containing protein [Lacibacter sp.]HMO89313.1 helix-turn-helix domain-containing protein [Lacibacter sp.]